MGKSREYEIAWKGLKDGHHVYEYDTDAAFFQPWIDSLDPEMLTWKGKVTVDFLKDTSLFQLHFRIEGTYESICDRCGDPLPIEVWDEHKLIIKLVDAEVEDPESVEDADFTVIQRSETVIDLAEWIYEYILLSLPIQKLHGEDSDGRSMCNPEALKYLTTTEEDIEALGEEKRTSNLWKGLDRLKNLEDNNN
jgi:uncharacterized metal-binding protein YceD (DUF177 family)